MSKNLTYDPIQKISIKIDEDIPAFRFVDASGSLCAESEKAIGVTDSDWLNGDVASVVSLGTAIIETSGAVAVGDKVSCSTNGMGKTIFGSEEINGWALTATSGAGFIKIIVAQ